MVKMVEVINQIVLIKMHLATIGKNGLNNEKRQYSTKKLFKILLLCKITNTICLELYHFSTSDFCERAYGHLRPSVSSITVILYHRR